VVAARDQPWELYDLSADRSETHDRAAAHPQRLKAMTASWESMAREMIEQAPVGAR